MWMQSAAFSPPPDRCDTCFDHRAPPMNTLDSAQSQMALPKRVSGMAWVARSSPTRAPENFIQS